MVVCLYAWKRKIQFPPNAILESNKTKAFTLTNAHEIFFFIINMTVIKNKLPIKPRIKAISLEDKSMYLTNTPIVPKMIIDNRNENFDFIVYSFESAKPLIFRGAGDIGSGFQVNRFVFDNDIMIPQF